MKRFISKYIFSMRTLLLLVIAATILYAYLHPQLMYRGDYFNTTTNNTAVTARAYLKIPSIKKPIVLVFTPLDIGLKVFFYNVTTGNKPELTLANLTGEVKPWWDEEDQCVRTICHERDSGQMVMLSIWVAEDASVSTHETYLWDISEYRTLSDTILTCKGVKFLPSVNTESDTAVSIIRDDGGYRFGLSTKSGDRRIYLYAPNVKSDETLQDAASRLNAITGGSFTSIDIYRIIQTFRRNNWYYGEYIEPGLLPVENWGNGIAKARCDCNGDGVNDLLVEVNGNRYLQSSFGCWDLKADSLQWVVYSAGWVRFQFAADIDNDGRDEVCLGTNAPGNQMSPNWHDFGDIGTTQTSYFIVLDDDGSTYKWGDKAGRIEMGGYANVTNAVYIEEMNSAIIYIHQNNELSEKNFRVMNFADGTIDTVGTYHYLFDTKKDKDGWLLYDWDGKRIQTIRVASDGSMSIENTYPYSDLPIGSSGSLHIDGITYGTEFPAKIIDENYNTVYEEKNSYWQQISTYNDTLYYVRPVGTLPYGALSVIGFQRNKDINQDLYFLIGFELLLLAIWWVVHSFIMAPIASADKGYIVLWSILGRLYIWKPLGKASIYKLPKYIAFDKKYFSSSIGSLSRDFRCIFQRNLVLMDFTVYELEKVNELEVVQHIAHELKNQLLVMQYGLSEIPGDVPQELSESVKWCSKAAKIISDFSRVHTLNKQSVDIRDVIEEIAHSLMARPNAELLVLELPDEPLIAPIDRYLMKMALRNLIENAIQAIDENGWVKVLAIDEGESVKIRISNPGDISNETLHRILTKGGWGNKEGGTGVGVSIARIIVSNHDGTLEMTCHDHIVKTIVTLSVNT